MPCRHVGYYYCPIRVLSRIRASTSTQKIKISCYCHFTLGADYITRILLGAAGVNPLVGADGRGMRSVDELEAPLDQGFDAAAAAFATGDIATR